MRKRHKLLIALISLPLIAALVLLLYPKPNMPTYGGKPLPAWAEQFVNSISEQERQEARIAIRAICPGKISTLVDWLDYDPWPRKARLYRDFHRLPAPLRIAIEDGPLADRNELRADTASIALTALGPELGLEIAPALPRLAKLLNGTNDVISERAMIVAGRLGTNGLAILLPIAADENNPRRYEALATIDLMSYLRTNASSAIPTLVRCTESSDPKIVTVAAQALGMLRIEPATCVPALTAVVTNADPKARARAIRALGRFGPLAQPAGPSLVQALQDPILEPRVEATNALRQVQSRVPTNTPAH